MRLAAELVSQPESTIDTDIYMELIERCAFVSNDSDFMFKLGLSQPLSDLGLAGQALVSASTAAETFDLLDMLLKYLQSQSSVEITRRGNRSQIRYGNWHHDDWASRLDVKYSVGIITNILLQLEYASEPDITIYSPLANGGPFRRGNLEIMSVSSTTGTIEFNTDAVCPAIPAVSSERFEILQRFFSANTPVDLMSMDFTTTTTELIRSGFAVAPVSEPGIATLFGTSTRTLKRRLQAEGTTYRDILRDVRKTIAVEELAAGRNITEIALKLGYDHPQNFTTAFQKWFGTNPSAYRKI
ncbi:MAG: helix-turn-helix domain-containing protein [Roseibium sp.]